MKNRDTKLLIAIVLLLSITSPLLAFQSGGNPPPLRRVTLYKHGVGYFERQGKVTGDQQVSFSFDPAQMNDVLKSLVVLDLSKGKISSVTFDSTKPLDKRLEEFGISLDETDGAGLTGLLGQLKGTRVEIRSGALVSAGTIIGLEKRARIQGQEKVESQELALVIDGGELRSIPLDQIRGIKLLDAKLREDLERYLSILQSTVRKNAKSLTISTTGQGERDLFVSYVVEAPVWKTTYRVVIDSQDKPFLQGWAIVDNVQDEDWTDVSLSLVAGLPVSFIQDLQQPRYRRRPEIAIPDDVSLSPQAPETPYGLPGSGMGMGHGIAIGTSSIEGVVTDHSGGSVSGATVTIREMNTGKEVIAKTNSAGRYAVHSLPSGRYEIKVESPGFKTSRITGVSIVATRAIRKDVLLEVGGISEAITITDKAEELATTSASVMSRVDSGIEVTVSTQEIGELFEYRIDHPVTIKRNSSAMIPIIQSKIEGESVSLYNERVHKHNPMSALYLTNTTGLTLESGPITVIENSTYSGEALTSRIKPGEKRFITYAVDLGCRISTKLDEEDKSAFLTEIVNGEFRIHYKQGKSLVYTITNVTDRAKTVFIEHPYDKQWQLVKTPEPVETTENFRRFKVSVAPNSTTQFTVNEELPQVGSYILSNITTENIKLFVSRKYINEQMQQALNQILDLKVQIASLSRQLQDKQQEINTVIKDQERMRDSLRALGKGEDERKLVSRYVAKISQDEDQIERLRQEEKQIIDGRSAFQRQLDDLLRKLAIENRLSQ